MGVFKLGRDLGSCVAEHVRDSTRHDRFQVWATTRPGCKATVIVATAKLGIIAYWPVSGTGRPAITRLPGTCCFTTDGLYDEHERAPGAFHRAAVALAVPAARRRSPGVGAMGPH